MFIKIITLGFSFLCTSITDASRPLLFADKNEYVYEYTGKIILSPNDGGDRSSYIINADLHISPLEDGLWMTLKNVTYEIYSGDSNNDESTKAPIPEDSESISIPFISHRYKNESQYGITVHKDDKAWSKNLKQAIANLIFLDSRAFKVNENTEFVDDDQFTYYILPEENNILVERFKYQDYYNLALEPKFKHYKEQRRVLPVLKRQTYNFNIDEDRLILWAISYVTTIDHLPFDGNSEAYFSTINQYLENKEIIAIDDNQKFNRDNMEYVEIDFNPKMYTRENGVYDFTMGRESVDLDALTTNIKSDLVDFVKHYHESQITLSKFYLKNKHSVDFLIQRVRDLDTDHLSKLYSNISNLSDHKMMNVLLQIMSLTGTPSPYFFIMDLISESKISEDVSIKLLENMPKHVTQYYPKLIKRMWNLIEDKSTTKKIRDSAILSMSSILHWAKCEDKITEILIERLIKAENEEVKILIINALRNIRCETSDMTLLKIVKDKSITTHVRAIALMNLKSENHLSYLWMILFNKVEALEVRVMALHLLTDPQYPDHYDKIFSYLSSDGDEDLKHFFMTKCESLSTTTVKSYEETKSRIKSFLPHIKWHTKTPFLSSSYLFDYVDSDFGFGTAALVTYYGNLGIHKFTSVHVQLLDQSINSVWNQDEYYFHIRWTSDEPKVFEMMYDFLTTNYKGCIIDVLSIRNQDVTMYKSFKMDKGFNFFRFVDRYMKLDISSLNVDQSLNTEIVIPTDLGWPLIFFSQKSQITNIDAKIFHPNRNMTLYVKYRGNEIYGFKSYNPISNTWHGIKRVHTSDAYIPIDFNIVRNGISLKLKINHGDDAFGFQSYVYKQIFLYNANDDDSTIKVTCPKCEPHIITKEDDLLENHTLWYSDSEDTGLDYKMAIFDCDDKITASHSAQLIPRIQTMLDDYNKNFDTFPVTKVILALHHFWKSVTLSPSIGTCGFGLMMNKSINNPVTHIDLVIENKRNTIFDHIMFKETDFKFAYYLKNNDALLKSWNADFSYNMKKNTEYAIKVDAKSTKSNIPDYRFCLDVVDKWSYNQMTSDWTIVMGNDHDGKCPKDGSKVKISMTAGMTEEMKNMQEKIGTEFANCDNNNILLFSECIKDVTSYMSYNIDIKYEKLSNKTMHWLNIVSDFFRLTYSYEFVRMEHKADFVKPGHVKIAINFPYYFYNRNVSVITSTESYRYDNIPYNSHRWLQYVDPYSAFMKYDDFMFSYCEAGKDYMTYTEGGLKYKVKYSDDGWLKLASSFSDEISWKISMKKSPDEDSKNLILRVQFEDEILELNYIDNELEIHMKGEKMPLEFNDRYHNGKWIDYMILRDGDKSSILINLKTVIVNVYFNYDIVKLMLPFQMPEKLFVGQCDVDYKNNNSLYS